METKFLVRFSGHAVCFSRCIDAGFLASINGTVDFRPGARVVSCLWAPGQQGSNGADNIFLCSGLADSFGFCENDNDIKAFSITKYCTWNDSYGDYCKNDTLQHA